MTARLRFVSPTERVLYLKSLPLWHNVPVGDLLGLAQVMHEHPFSRGEQLFVRGEPARSAYLIVDGTVELGGAGAEMRSLGPHSGIGFPWVLARSDAPLDARARTNGLALEIAGEDLRQAHAESARLLQQCLRHLASSLPDASCGLAPLVPAVEGSEPGEPPPLGFVDRLIALSQTVPFRHANLEGVAELARHQHEVRFEPGQYAWRLGAPSTFFLHVIHGNVACSTDAPPGTPATNSNRMIGLLDALAERPRSCSLLARSRVVALRTDMDRLFAVLEDDSDLTTSLTEMLASTLLSGEATSAAPRASCTLEAQGRDGEVRRLVERLNPLPRSPLQSSHEVDLLVAGHRSGGPARTDRL